MTTDATRDMNGPACRPPTDKPAWSPLFTAWRTGVLCAGGLFLLLAAIALTARAAGDHAAYAAIGTGALAIASIGILMGFLLARHVRMRHEVRRTAIETICGVTADSMLHDASLVTQQVEERQRLEETERRIAESERRFRTLIEGTNVIIWEFDPEQDAFTYVSPQAARLGYPIEDWMQPGFRAAHIHPGDRNAITALRSGEAHEGGDHRYQYRMLTADGRVVWVDDRVSTDRAPHGKTLLRGVLVDITEQRTAEQATEEAKSIAEAALREISALHTALDEHMILSTADRSGRIIDVNTSFCRISGYTREELLGQDHRILNSGMHPKAFWVDVWKSLTTGRAWRGEICNRRKDGSKYWVDSTIVSCHGADGSIEKYVSIRFDITAHVNAEAQERLQLEGTEGRLQVAKAMAGGGMLKRRLGDALQSVLSMHGLNQHPRGGVLLKEPASEELTLLTTVGAFPETFHARASRIDLKDCLCGQAAESGDIRICPRSTAGCPLHAQAPGEPAHGAYIVPLLDRSGPTFECVGLLFLHTEEEPDASPARLRALQEIGGLMTTAILQDRAVQLAETARQRAEQANRAKSEFLANMSHEIRTPLTAILGYADLLREEMDRGNLPAQHAETIDTIRHTGDHLLSITNDVLDLSKIEAGAMTIEHIETPLIRVLSDVTELMRLRASDRNIRLTTSLHTPVPDRIMSDPTRLRQILLNIVGNAVKFTERGDIQIRITTSGPDVNRRLSIRVEDSGPGMTAQQAAVLFRPFTQADSSITRRHGGTGMGLTISRRLAKLMGGDLVLEFTSPGRGSRFLIELPLVDAPGASTSQTLDDGPAPAAERGVAQGDTLRGRILLAEDGPDNQRLISFVLSRAGAHVDVADNGIIALDMLGAAASSIAAYDLLVSDMQMPEMDGYTLVQTLRAAGNTMPVLALTAHAMADDRARCMAAGCDAYATKPIDRRALIRACAELMDGARDANSSLGAEAALKGAAREVRNLGDEAEAATSPKAPRRTASSGS